MNKQVLLGCVAASAIVVGVACIIWDLNSPKVEPQKEPVVAEESIHTYSTMEDNILEAINGYLYAHNINDINVDIKPSGNDYIITITQEENGKSDSHELNLVRIEDFNGAAQYKLTSQSHLVWDRLLQENGADTELKIGSYEESISWVPALGLVTQESTKANQIHLENELVNMDIESIINDALVGMGKNNKMDFAGSTDLTNVSVDTVLAKINIPHLTQSFQVHGTEANANRSIQLISNEYAEFKLDIPQIEILPFLQENPFKLAFSLESQLQDAIHVNANVTNLNSQEQTESNEPIAVSLDADISEISRQDLITYAKMIDTYQSFADRDSQEAMALEEIIISYPQKLLKQAQININTGKVEFENGSMDFTGTVKDENGYPVTRGQLAVTNFEKLSPAANEESREACRLAMEAQAQSGEQVQTLPDVCATKGGMLDRLRPFLKSAKHEVLEDGQTVDTFDITNGPDGLMINNDSVSFDAFNIDYGTNGVSIKETTKDTAPEVISTETDINGNTITTTLYGDKLTTVTTNTEDKVLLTIEKDMDGNVLKMENATDQQGEGQAK